MALVLASRRTFPPSALLPQLCFTRFAIVIRSPLPLQPEHLCAAGAAVTSIIQYGYLIDSIHPLIASDTACRVYRYHLLLLCNQSLTRRAFHLRMIFEKDFTKSVKNLNPR